MPEVGFHFPSPGGVVSVRKHLWKNVYKNEAQYCLFFPVSKWEGGRGEVAQRQVKNRVFHILRRVQYVRSPIIFRERFHLWRSVKTGSLFLDQIHGYLSWVWNRQRHWQWSEKIIYLQAIISTIFIINLHKIENYFYAVFCGKLF
jgi:hypothetical protein